MKLIRVITFSLVLLFAFLTLSVSADQWDKDDYEIFELQSALEASEGKGANFYSVLGITRSATSAEIKQAYRKRSRELHPDKNPGVADAQKRFERLGLINKILRDDRKDRYDHFLSNGFPKWRGTGYFYSRFRPGLGSVFGGLVLFSVGVELLARKLSAAQEKAKVDRLRRSAQLVAWGPRFQSIEADAKSPSEKKVRVPLSGFDLPPAPSAKGGKVDWDEEESKIRKAMAAGLNGGQAQARTVDVLVSPTSVLVHDKLSDEWLSLNEDSVHIPTLRDTWPFRIFARKAEIQDLHPDETADQVEQDAKQLIANANGNGNGNGNAGGARKRKGKK